LPSVGEETRLWGGVGEETISRDGRLHHLTASSRVIRKLIRRLWGGVGVETISRDGRLHHLTAGSRVIRKLIRRDGRDLHLSKSFATVPAHVQTG